MFEVDIPLIRRKYYLMSVDMDRFIQLNDEDEEYSFTSEIEVALSLYDKPWAFVVCNICNERGMNVKVVEIEISYSLWNEDVLI